MIVLNYRTLNKGALICAFDLEEQTPFGPRIIYGITLFEKNGKKWLAFPQRESEKDGKKVYFQHIRFPTREHQWAFEKALFPLIEKEAASTGSIMIEDDLPF